MFIHKLKNSVIQSAFQNAGHNYARSNFFLSNGLYLFDSLSDWLWLKLKFSEKCLERLREWKYFGSVRYCCYSNFVVSMYRSVNSVRTMQCRTLKLAKYVAFFVRGKKYWRFIWWRNLMEDSEEFWKMDLNRSSWSTGSELAKDCILPLQNRACVCT